MQTFCSVACSGQGDFGLVFWGSFFLFCVFYVWVGFFLLFLILGFLVRFLAFGIWGLFFFFFFFVFSVFEGKTDLGPPPHASPGSCRQELPSFPSTPPAPGVIPTHTWRQS